MEIIRFENHHSTSPLEL